MSRAVRKLLAPVVWAGAIFAWLYAAVFGAVLLGPGGTPSFRSVLGLSACVAAGIGCAWAARRLGRGARAPAWVPMVLPDVPAPPRWRPPAPKGPLPAEPAARELYLLRRELGWLRKRVAPGWNSLFHWRFRLRLLPLLRGAPLMAAVFGIGCGCWAAVGLLGIAHPVQPTAPLLDWAGTVAALIIGGAGAALIARDVILGVRRAAALLEREPELTHRPTGGR